MLKLLESFKKRIWKNNLDDENRLELYKNIHQSAKNISRCLDELLYEYKNEQLEDKKQVELIITTSPHKFEALEEDGTHE